jgi:hypothetical protein
MSERPARHTQSDTRGWEADPADVADQELPAFPDPDPEMQEVLDEELPLDADPADVAEQRQVAHLPPEEPAS